MADLNRTRKWLAIAVTILVLLDVAAALALLSPVAGSQNSRRQELLRLRRELALRQAAPWRGLDAKIPQAREQINSFYHERFPSGYSAISSSLDHLASESGVRITGEKYKQNEAEIQSLQQIEVEADVSGDYLQLMRFINGLERSRLFFLVEELELGGRESGVVHLRIKLGTYLRTV
jgi:hypothetical protein